MDQDTKAKIIVGAVISVVVLFIIVYSVVVFGGDKSTQPSEKVSFAAPELKRKEYEYNRRIDLINEKGYKPEPKEVLQEDSPQLQEEKNMENPFLSEIEESTKARVSIQPKQRSTQQVKGTPKINPGSTYKQVNQTEPVAQAGSTTQRRKKRYLDQENTQNKTSGSSYQVSESIPCLIYGDHKVTNNSKIKARITKDVTINNVDIKRNTIVTGIVRLDRSRVNIRFETIQYKNKTINANMRAYSRDGLEGIYIEGGVGEDIKKDSYDEIIDAASPSTVERIPVVGGLIKNTTKKQNNRVYVDIPNDYTIYLRK